MSNQYSDNLYSLDDSDNESFSGELSPTDGYFENRGHPQDIMVEDPSVASSSTAESKAQEARRESEANSEGLTTPSVASPTISTASPSQTFTPAASTAAYVPSSSSSHAPQSPTSSYRRSADGIYSDTSALLNPAPPPAYSPATSPITPTSPSINTFARNYGTLSSRQLEEGVAFNREPESMGGPPPHEVSEITPLWRKQPKFTRTRSCVKGCLLVLLVLTVFISLLVTLITGSTDGGHYRPGHPKHSPVPGNPKMGNSYCPTATIHRTNYPEYEFKPEGQLSVIQTHKDSGSSHSGQYVSTAGRVIFRRIPHDRKDKEIAFTTFDIWTTDEKLSAEIDLSAGDRTIKAFTPRYADGLAAGIDHCISLEMTIWLPWNASFESLNVFTTPLSVEVFDDIHIHLSDSATFETVSGSVMFPAIDNEDPTLHKPTTASETKTAQLFHRAERGFTSREVRIHTSSGSVTGAFSLYDLLDIKTISGHVDISVAPQEAGKNKRPAVLEIETKSGNIDSRLPTYANPVIPKRDYHTSVTAISGHIFGSFYLGTESHFSSTSGTIKLDVLPGLSDGKSSFSTKGFSGSAEIEILPLPQSVIGRDGDKGGKWFDIGDGDPYLFLPPPPNDHSKIDTPASIATRSAIRKLHSTHDTKSGSQKILYPSEWEGMIHVLTMSGSIKVGGDGVKTIYDGRDGYGGFNKKLDAEKGEDAGDASVVNVTGLSGSVEVWIGPK